MREPRLLQAFQSGGLFLTEDAMADAVDGFEWKNWRKTMGFYPQKMGLSWGVLQIETQFWDKF